MSATTQTPAPVTNPYGTTAHPEIQRHHWQGLAGMVASFRPEWDINKILDNLWWSRNEQSFPELAHIALTVAMDPRFKGPGAIGMMAAGVFDK